MSPPHAGTSVAPAASRPAPAAVGIAAAVEASGCVVVLLDAGARVSWGNARAHEVLGPDLRGAPLGRLLSPSHDAAFLDGLRRAVAAGERWRGECLLRGREAHGILDLSVAPIASPDGTRAVGVAMVLSDHRTCDASLCHLVRVDRLTGLANRRGFMEATAAALANAAALGLSAGVMVVDIDHFGDINTRCGHDVADALLRDVGARLGALHGAEQTVARLGEDQFGIVRLGRLDEEETLPWVEEVRAAVAAPCRIGGAPIRVTASVGLAVVCDLDTSMEAAVAGAEAALRRAKAHGRDGWCLFDPVLDQASHRHARLRRDLAHALEGGGLHLVFQPIVRLAGRGLVGVEALCRWTHPELGPVSPGEFVPLAEAAGLAARFDLWVLDEALRQAAGWTARHGPRAPHVSVNVSPKQIQSPAFTDAVLDRIARHRIDPGLLTLELTEHAVLQSPAAALRELGRLSAAGVALAIDDFGTGYASFAYLRDLPATRLKIDATFVRRAEGGTKDGLIVAAVAALAEAFGLECVAEGVETEAHEGLCAGHGIRLGQGWLYGRPMPPEAVDAMIAA